MEVFQHMALFCSIDVVHLLPCLTVWSGAGSQAGLSFLVLSTHQTRCSHQVEFTLPCFNIVVCFRELKRRPPCAFG